MPDQENRGAETPNRGGGPGSAPGDGLDRGRAWLTGIGLGALGIAALVIAFTIGTNYSDEPATVVAVDETVTESPAAELSPEARDLFAGGCGACHKLADADSTGTSGPDLDKLSPDAELVKKAIAQGGTGSGMMPPGLMVGADAEAVSDYVAAAAGGG